MRLALNSQAPATASLMDEIKGVSYQTWLETEIFERHKCFSTMRKSRLRGPAPTHSEACLLQQKSNCMRKLIQCLKKSKMEPQIFRHILSSFRPFD